MLGSDGTPNQSLKQSRQESDSQAHTCIFACGLGKAEQVSGHLFLSKLSSYFCFQLAAERMENLPGKVLVHYNIKGLECSSRKLRIHKLHCFCIFKALLLGYFMLSAPNQVN